MRFMQPANIRGRRAASRYAKLRPRLVDAHALGARATGLTSVRTAPGASTGRRMRSRKFGSARLTSGSRPYSSAARITFASGESFRTYAPGSSLRGVRLVARYFTFSRSSDGTPNRSAPDRPADDGRDRALALGGEPKDELAVDEAVRGDALRLDRGGRRDRRPHGAERPGRARRQHQRQRNAAPPRPPAAAERPPRSAPGRAERGGRPPSRTIGRGRGQPFFFLSS